MGKLAILVLILGVPAVLSADLKKRASADEVKVAEMAKPPEMPKKKEDPKILFDDLDDDDDYDDLDYFDDVFKKDPVMRKIYEEEKKKLAKKEPKFPPLFYMFPDEKKKKDLGKEDPFDSKFLKEFKTGGFKPNFKKDYGKETKNFQYDEKKMLGGEEIPPFVPYTGYEDLFKKPLMKPQYSKVDPKMFFNDKPMVDLGLYSPQSLYTIAMLQGMDPKYLMELLAKTDTKLLKPESKGYPMFDYKKSLNSKLMKALKVKPCADGIKK